MKIKVKIYSTYSALLAAVNVALLCGYEITEHRIEDAVFRFKYHSHCDTHKSYYTLEHDNSVLILGLDIANVVMKKR